MTSEIDEIKLEGTAEKAAFLINGSQYFSQLADTLRRAQRRIWIVGWDFNPNILLEPQSSNQTLGELLESCARANPDLQIKILIWALGPVYSKKSLSVVSKANFPQNGGIDLRFAFQPAVRGCHHEKLVCVDDTAAFIGGIDLTSRRWDTYHHKVRDRLRCDPEGVAYDPLHDLQVMVTGEAAALISKVARQRWRDATGETYDAVAIKRVPDWLNGSAVTLSDVPVKLAVSKPTTLFKTGLRQGIRLTMAMIARAERQLYIETQYLASFNVSEALAARLQEPNGPEIVIVCTATSHGWIENTIMGGNRDRIIQRLRRADRNNRLRVFHPVVHDGCEQAELLVHSKLQIADDKLLRMGSSNLNHRSEGLDTECDILFEASRHDHCLAIAHLRDLLVAEYFGCSVDAVKEATHRKGSLIGAIEELNVNRKTLRAFVPTGEKYGPVFATSIVDPSCPIGQSARAFCRRVAGRIFLFFRTLRSNLARNEDQIHKRTHNKKTDAAKCSLGTD
ncbi:phospholipase D-like domain-containing protein [Rhizobium mesoamericanum]|uniref:Phospholipase D n=1 Tax=Rhizobium mesoamericanum STM3625 TaxID=1211777 RepID=K0PNM2_9HYPH|nr:phospholipase D-like domain-containing protein [Rhizobium mesoamericanum]CCM78121.1 putative phospholipase D protein [Rhizobium mesoamericanum STM3625]